jgi:ketosteroid isomerase-like protein
MKRIMKLLCVSMAIAMAVGCARGGDTQMDAQAIRDTEKQWNMDFASKDTDKLVAYYADDAVLMAPTIAPSVGRESIRATLHQMVSDPALTLKFSAATIDVAKSGDLAYTRGA